MRRNIGCSILSISLPRITKLVGVRHPFLMNIDFCWRAVEQIVAGEPRLRVLHQVFILSNCRDSRGHLNSDVGPLTVHHRQSTVKDIPFFYYDIVARIFPGAVVIVLVTFTVPEIERFVSGSESWKTATVPLAFIGLSYMIGVLFEVLFTDWLVWQWVGDRTFGAAASKHAWSQGFQSPTLANRDECRVF